MVVPKALFLPHQVFPDEVLPLLMVGFATGTPGTALRRALEILRSRRLATALLVRLVHFVLFLLVYTGIMGFLLLYIAPKFVVIFRDFHIELPPVTRWFIEFFRWSQHPLSLFVWGIIVVLLWLGIYYLLRIFNAVSWDPPGIRRLTWRPHTAAVLDGLALAVENQRPLPECLESLAQKYPQQSIRTRLHRVAEDLQANVACWDSLHRRGLIGRADRTLLEAAQRADNLAWALGEVAASQRRRWMGQLNVIANLLYPAIILAMGILVLWTMVAFFTPLVYLIKGLA
jgi:general secretion pathway protein F